MTFPLVLFLVGVLGFVLNRKSVLLLIMSIELMLLAVTLLVIVASHAYDDVPGEAFGVYVMGVAGAESAIGLGILVAYYRLRGTITLPQSA